MDRRRALLQQCSELEGLTPCYDLDTWECDFDANGYRLPTEAEWEYACRAGSTGKYCFGDDEDELPQYAWFKPHSQGKPRPVDQKQPNRWGLYDMHGNVWQWCNDWYGETYYDESPAENPRGPATGKMRVLRGGAWDCTAEKLRSAYRHKEFPVYSDACFGADSYGFRRARNADGGDKPAAVAAVSESTPIPKTREPASRPRGVRACPSGAGFGTDRPGQPQGNDRLRQRSRRHHENLEHARQRQGRETTHEGHRPRRRSAFLARWQADPLHHAARRFPGSLADESRRLRAEVRHQGLAGQLGAGRQVDRLHPGQSDVHPRPGRRQGRLRHTQRMGALRSPGLQLRTANTSPSPAGTWGTSASSSSAWTARRTTQLKAGEACCTPQWSKDGKKILCQTVQGHIHQVGVDGKNWEQLTFGADVQHDARYSPDGTMILFCRAPAPEGPWQICLKQLDGDEEEFVQLTKEGSNLLPDWHPSEE